MKERVVDTREYVSVLREIAAEGKVAVYEDRRQQHVPVSLPQ